MKVYQKAQQQQQLRAKSQQQTGQTSAQAKTIRLPNSPGSSSTSTSTTLGSPNSKGQTRKTNNVKGELIMTESYTLKIHFFF